MGIVVAIVAFNLQMISNAGFTVLVLAAIATSVIAPQLLRLTVNDWEVPEEEQARLSQEALRDSSVILRVKRVLLPTRGGRNSVYAARLLAGVFPEMELTILAIDPGEPGLVNRLLRRRAGQSDPSAVVDAVSDIEGVKVSVVNRVARDITTAVAEEAQLGYDLVALGASEEESDGTRIFSNVVERILGRLTIPSLVVRFPTAERPSHELPQRVLVPVTRSASARAAEEMAYSLSRSSNGSVTALHVVNRPEGQGALVEEARISESTDAAVTMLSEAAELGAKLGVSVTTSVKVDPQAEAAIIEEANGGEYDLLLLGSATRPLSNRAFFGHRVTYIIENSAIPVAILSLPDQAFPDPELVFGE
jgi:nucleotide-binding universal stress UspA family protein